jgi:hypothetical protein
LLWSWLFSKPARREPHLAQFGWSINGQFIKDGSDGKALQAYGFAMKNAGRREKT